MLLKTRQAIAGCGGPNFVFLTPCQRKDILSLALPN